jgi:catechol 2,3-dioxygenase
MDAPNPSALPTFASRTPLRIGAVGLAVRDLDKLTRFYQGLLGLTVQERTGKVARLGTGGVTLLELEHRPDALPDDPATAGLYHTAFLMPTRADHARWIMHIAKNQVPITGASDHGVSEAIYLRDPDGNGIELYHDRPRDQWPRRDGQSRMTTEPLDLDGLLAELHRFEPKA